MPDYSFLLRPLLIALGLALVGGTSFVGGCEYHKDKQAKEKLAEVKVAAKLEKTDGIAGAKAVSIFKETEAAYKQGTADALAKAAGKPLIIVKTKTQDCTAKVAESQNLETSKESVNETSTNASVDSDVASFSSDFMRLYDTTAQPGNAELRTRTYGAAETVRVDEGSTLIAKNNEYCALKLQQLDALISRIEEKQKIFKEKH